MINVELRSFTTSSSPDLISSYRRDRLNPVIDTAIAILTLMGSMSAGAFDFSTGAGSGAFNLGRLFRTAERLLVGVCQMG